MKKKTLCMRTPTPRAEQQPQTTKDVPRAPLYIIQLKGSAQKPGYRIRFYIYAKRACKYTFSYSTKHIIKRACIRRKSEFFFYLLPARICDGFIFLFFLSIYVIHANIWAGHGSLPSTIFNHINGLFFREGKTSFTGFNFIRRM